MLDHRFRLVLFRDLAELAERAGDLGAVEGFATEHGLRALTWTALTAARHFAEAPIDPSFMDRLGPRTLVERFVRREIRHVDPLRFDGHSVHPLNLGIVLLHDDLSGRLALAGRAAGAFSGWRSRTTRLAQAQRRSALVLVTSDQRRGAEVFGSKIAAGLADRGWDVEIMSLSSGEGPTIDTGLVAGARPGKPPPLSPELIAGVRSAMRAADVVLANGSATIRYAVAARLTMLRRPALVASSIGEPEFWAARPRRRRLQRWMLSHVDLVAAVSEETARQLIEFIQLDPGSVRYAPTGVEMSAVPQRDAGGPLRLAFVGSLSSEKRPDLLFDVLARVEDDLVVELVGDGPMREDLEERAAADPRVSLVGAVADVAPHLRTAHVLVQTSVTEGLPGVIMEAAALGVPAVAFDVGGTRELVVDGVTGILVPDGDTEAMAQAVKSMAHDRTLVCELGDAARKHVSRSFTLSRAIDRYESVLLEAAEKRRR